MTTHRPGASAKFLAAFAVCLVIPLAWALTGCGASRQVATPPPAETPADPAPAPVPTPAMKLRIASLDVSGFSGRIEKTLVDELARLIAGRKIDLLAVQGITRYPTVRTRTDLVDELAEATGMRQAFGETINVSGRQSGNALFCTYPILSSDAHAYDGISGSGFEAALRAIVDAGTRPLVVVSTRLPDPLSAADARICATTISTMESERGTDPLIVLGNLPAPPGGGRWEEVVSDGEGLGTLWYTPGEITVSRGGTAICTLGTLLIADIDIFPRSGR